MTEGRTEIRKAFLSGTTRRVRLRIIDTETREGFQPTTLMMSVYDVVESGILVPSSCCYRTWPYSELFPPVTSSIVNDQNDVDVSAFVDADGNVDLYLEPADTEIDVPSVIRARYHQRVLLFTWTWGSPAKTGKHEIVLSIAPDRETAAS